MVLNGGRYIAKADISADIWIFLIFDTFDIFQISASGDTFFCLTDVFDFYFDSGENSSILAHSAHILPLHYLLSQFNSSF